MSDLTVGDMHVVFTNMAGIAGRESNNGRDGTPEELADVMLEYAMFHEPKCIAAAQQSTEQFIVSGIEGNEYNLLNGRYPLPGFTGFSREEKRLIFKAVECLCEKLRAGA